MSRLVDLSLPIGRHWRWLSLNCRPRTHEAGDHFQQTVLTLSMHAFTHVDAPVHFVPGATSIDAVPLEIYSGEASVVDLTQVLPEQGISASDLERQAGGVRQGDIALLRTDWPRRRDFRTMEFWSEAPYIEAAACDWLARRGVKAVGFDFPGDQLLRYEVTDRRHRAAKEEYTTHQQLLARGIGLIEYLVNLDQLPQARVLLYALPLKVEGGDGSPVRAVAVVE